MEKMGFGKGWGNTVGRAKDTIRILLDIIQAPDAELLQAWPPLNNLLAPELPFVVHMLPVCENADSWQQTLAILLACKEDVAMLYKRLIPRGFVRHLRLCQQDCILLQ